MPHDCKGRLIEKGDVVRARYNEQDAYEAKIVKQVYEGSDTCNLTARGFDPFDGAASHNAKDCELLLKKDGSLPETPATS